MEPQSWTGSDEAFEVTGRIFPKRNQKSPFEYKRESQGVFLIDPSSCCLESGLEEGRNESQETVKCLAWWVDR